MDLELFWSIYKILHSSTRVYDGIDIQHSGEVGMFLTSISLMQFTRFQLALFTLEPIQAQLKGSHTDRSFFRRPQPRTK